MDKVKEAFDKVKQDIDFLKSEIFFLKENLRDISNSLTEIVSKNGNFQQPLQENIPTQNMETQTSPTYIPTDNTPFKPLNDQISTISTGNRGVPTDRQTNQQTDRQITPTEIKAENPINNAAEIMESLDNIKKEIRLKFKRLTEQEILIFSTIYQLEEENHFTDYRTLSQKLGLSESSVRDYVGKLIKKDIPLEKIKVNNKQIQLKISQNLKKLASLSTILKLREL